MFSILNKILSPTNNYNFSRIYFKYFHRFSSSNRHLIFEYNKKNSLKLMAEYSKNESSTNSNSIWRNSYIPNELYLSPVNENVRNPINWNVNQYYSTNHSEYNQPIKMENLRKWEFLCPETSHSKLIFTIMSYNVLAQDLLVQHSYLYTNSNPQILSWNVRWNNIFLEIKRLNPDILCLQEVQQSHISEYFSTLQSLGYQGVYKKRTGLRTDGCAIYYKNNIFNLIEYITVEYNQPQAKILDRDNVAIIAKLSSKKYTNQQFIIATTHLLYNPKREDVRLIQVQLLLSEIDRMAFIPNKKDNNYLPVVITGDFNSSPGSAIYEFLCKGELNYEFLSRRSLKRHMNTEKTAGKILLPSKLRITDFCQHADLIKKRQLNESVTRLEESDLIKLQNSDRNKSIVSSDELNDKNLFSTGTLKHQFLFKSVYNHGIGENIEGTTYQDRWISVDYIFFSDNNKKLKLLERYRLPKLNQLKTIIIPNEQLGSDHFCLLAKFELL